MAFADRIASLKSKAQKKARQIRKQVADAVESGKKSIEDATRPSVPEFMAGQKDIARAFRQYAGAHPQEMKSGVADLVEKLLHGSEEMADILRLAGLFEHLIREGGEVLDDGMAGVGQILHGSSILDAARSLRTQATMPERQHVIDETLDRFRKKGKDAPGPVLQRVLDASAPIVRNASEVLARGPGLDALPFLRKDPSPIASQVAAIRDRFPALKSVVGEPKTPAELTFDVEAFEDLLLELAPAAQSATELVIDNVAGFTRGVGKNLATVLLSEIYVPGVTEMYRFATATRSQPKGRPLTVTSAFCFAAAYEIVSELKTHSIPMPLNRRQIETVTRMKFRDLAPDWDDIAGIVAAASEPLADTPEAGVRAPGGEHEPIIDEDIVTGVQILASAFDIKMKAVIAITNTGLSEEDQVFVGLLCNGCSLMAGLFKGPLLETVNMFGDVADDALPKGGVAGIVSLVFEWITWVVTAVTWLYKVVVQRFEKTVSPFVVTVLAVIAAITSLCALIAQTVRNVIVGRGVVVKELALTVAYLAELCGVVPEVFEFCKSAVTASATEGVSLAIELVVERVLPWAEVALASFGASLKFGELAFLGPEGGAG